MSVHAIGRDSELRQAAGVFDRLADGPAAVLLHGDAGIGKTTLWRAIVEAATQRGLTVLATRPAESEAGFAFGGLADLFRDVNDATLAGLPSPQRRALDVALLRAEPDHDDADPRALPAATVTVLRALADTVPVLVAVDDAQWLDSATGSALAYAARRLGTSPVGFVVAVRTPGSDGPLELETALPGNRLWRVRLGPLGVPALHDICESRLGYSFPRPVLVRIAEASAGNPFHALEVARQLGDPDDLRPGAPMPIPAEIRDLAWARIRRLPDATRTALLRAASLARPTTALVDPADLAPAEAEGLVEVGLDGRISFGHPLFAAAVYGDAPAPHRRAVHRALAGAVTELEERARHEALAATGPDPAVAALLSEAGRRARARGATDTAAELLELALRLTPSDAVEDRMRREIDRAAALHMAGQPLHAQRVLEAAIEHISAADPRSEALVALGMIYRETDQGRARAACEEALKIATSATIRARAHATLGLLYETVDVARATNHSAAAAALFAELGDTASWAAATIGHCWHELLLGHGADEATFRQALEARQAGPAVDQWWIALPPVWSLAHDDFATARAQLTAAVELARHEGIEGEIGLLQAIVAQVDCWRGRPAAADEGIAAAIEFARLGGSPSSLADTLRMQANIDARRGRVDRARHILGPGLAELGLSDAGRLKYAVGIVLGFIAHATGDEAQADALFARTTAALEAAGILEMPGYDYQGDHVEAVLALCDLERADALARTLEARAAVFPRPWTVAVAARCRGLVLAARGDLDGALAALEAALVHHDRLESPYELGRTLLAKAHVHRRRTEKRLARDTLERAVAQFETAGADLWAERARGELGRLRFRSAPTELTETELLIAELAAAGRTNREIASTVYVSPKTVESRLASAYGKLGIRSRAELGAWMAGRLSRGAPAPATPFLGAAAH